MNRRRFLEYGARVVALSPILGLAERFVSPVYAQAIPAAVMNRIAISTDCFRLQFKTTFARDQSGPPANLPLLDLLTAPKYIADQVGIHNVEIWAPHFEDLSIDYCRQIKAAAAADGSRIVNVQLVPARPLDGERALENVGWPEATGARRPHPPGAMPRSPRRGSTDAPTLSDPCWIHFAARGV